MQVQNWVSIPTSQGPFIFDLGRLVFYTINIDAPADSTFLLFETSASVTVACPIATVIEAITKSQWKN